jgi:hypothetical protein
VVDDTLVINADMLASSTVLFLESVCKLEVRPIQYKIVYNSALSEEETAVHKTMQNRRRQIDTTATAKKNIQSGTFVN